MSDDTSQWRKPQVIIPAAVVLLVALAMIAWLLTSRGDAPASPQAAPTLNAPVSSAAGAPAPPAGSTYDSACGLSGGTTTLPTTNAPAMDSWDDVSNGWRLPTSRAYGPGVKGDVRKCFARTPMGAVVAAYTTANQVDGLSQDFAGAVKAGTMPGVGQQQLLAQGRKALPASPTVVKGFLIDHYSNDEAAVSFYLSQPQMQTTCTFVVMWEDSDWRLRVNQDGSTPQGCIQGAPARYLPWGP